MRRRDFLVGATATAGFLATSAFAQTKPCPPSSLGVQGGGTIGETCASEEPISWVPPRGAISDIALNVLDSQAPVLGGIKTKPAGVMDAWCGMTYAATFGPLGSLVLYGGGHADYQYNELYRYDVADRLWSRISEPAYPVFTGPDGYLVDAEFGEYYSSTSGTAVQTGQVSADHTYGHTVWLPPGSIGDNPAGYYFTAGVATAVTLANRGNAWPHYMPLVPSTATWHRAKSKLGAGPGFGPALYDSRRKLVAVIPSADWQSTVNLFHCETQTSSTLTVKSPGLLAYYGTGGYDSDTDTYMVAAITATTSSAGSVLQLINPTTGAMKRVALSRTLPEATGGWDWVQPWGAWVYYPGEGNTVYKVKRPDDPWKETWVVTSETLNGTPDRRGADTPHFSRFRYVEPAGCFLWAAKTSGRVQAWNVTPV